MKKFLGYTRVSTAKQGEGVSLQEQRDAINRYALRNKMEITGWFEEKETAAKRGRPVFSQMLKLLKKGKADGLIIHKIDRSARNLKDWADLGEMIDQGIDVHFANEGLDLHSRGGRLSADIQAVVAADYIRNLREETRKGFYGRLKQGLYPLPAPLGYSDMGKGKPKELSEKSAPLIRHAFELYATGNYNLDGLGDEMFRCGLRNRRGGRVSRNGWSVILNNPFYIGLIRVRRTNETFPGSHQPLISKSLFDRVQLVLEGKFNARTQRHDFLFRRLLTCKVCGYSLVGETQKGHTYYRCHTKGCPTLCIRQDVVDRELRARLLALRMDEAEVTYLRTRISVLKDKWGEQQETVINSLNLKHHQLQDRLGRLTDAYVDKVIDREIFENRKTALLMERKNTEERLDDLKSRHRSIPNQVEEIFELARNAHLNYESREFEERRSLLRKLTSNREVEGKNLYVTMLFPYDEVSKRFKNDRGGPHRDIPRTWDKLLERLFQSLSNPQQGEAA